MHTEKISYSIVSHGQGKLVNQLLCDLYTFTPFPHEVIIVLNIPEDESFLDKHSCLPIRVLRNPSPLGFGANHNKSFAHSTGALFVVLNPDIRAPHLNLSNLIRLAVLQSVGVCAPLVLNVCDEVEDSARRFPTFSKLFSRFFLNHRTLDYCLPASGVTEVEWVAGMFMMFSRAVYESVSGFDTRYFMYMEDADICRRLHRKQYRTLIDSDTKVIHCAQRASARNIRHFLWHFRSAIRFLTQV